MGHSTKHLVATRHFAVAAALAALSLAGCGDDSGENPKPSITAGNGAGSTSTGTDGAGGGGDGGSDGAGGGCTEDGCYSCEPTRTEHFLDACTESQCSPFDNAARLPLFADGDLPPVP